MGNINIKIRRDRKLLHDALISETLYKFIVENDLVEDRREYDVEDLQNAYGINQREALLLFYKLHPHIIKHKKGD
jgi:hypothetical protein